MGAQLQVNPMTIAQIAVQLYPHIQYEESWKDKAPTHRAVLAVNEAVAVFETIARRMQPPPAGPPGAGGPGDLTFCLTPPGGPG